jgi:hypothetical protein
MTDCQPMSTPIELGLDLQKEITPVTSPESIKKYQLVIGLLMYTILSTTLDLAFAVSMLSQFTTNLGNKHWKALKRVFHYLKAMHDLGLEYGPFGDNDEPLFNGYTDSDWGGDKKSRKSISGYVFILGKGAVSWISKCQQTITLSFCEAEYMAMTLAAKEALWLSYFLKKISCTGSKLDTVMIYTDNQGTIALAKNPEYYAQTKHIDV